MEEVIICFLTDCIDLTSSFDCIAPSATGSNSHGFFLVGCLHKNVYAFVQISIEDLMEELQVALTTVDTNLSS